MTKLFSRKPFLVLATLATLTLSGTLGTSAAAQNPENTPVAAVSSAQPTQTISKPAADPAPSTAPQSGAVVADAAVDAPQAAPTNLADLVAQQSVDGELTPEIRCLATAVYFEAGHETLAGELAVGRVIVARTKSSRFPHSYCGVVMQPSQFSFVHHGALPTVKDTAVWRKAVAIAEIAANGRWHSKAEGALFFHATYVSPHWNRTRIAQVDNQIFYR